jgi:hypothetical protein
MTDELNVGRVRKPRFRRGLTWIAVKQVRLSSTESYAPGEELPPIRRHHAMHLWRKNFIGPKGDLWTEWALQSQGIRQERKAKAAAANAPIDPDNLQSKDEIEVESAGGGWYTVSKGGEELTKKRGGDALNQWLREHGYDEVTL